MPVLYAKKLNKYYEDIKTYWKREKSSHNQENPFYIVEEMQNFQNASKMMIPEVKITTKNVIDTVRNIKIGEHLVQMESKIT